MLVLGAGVAGLACAYELEKAGYAVTLLEARGRTGGRNVTVRPGTELTDTRGTTQRADFADGRWFNGGPARIATHHTTIDYCRELGVAIEPFINVNVDAYVVANGQIRRRRSLDADLDGYVAELLTKAIPTGVLDDEITAAEKDALYAAALASPWDTEVIRALETPDRFVTGKIGLEYDHRFWETGDRILGGITTTDREPREIWYPSHGYLGDGGVLIGAYPFGPAADRFSRLDHAARTDVALTAGEEVHGPVYRDELRSSLSVDWRTQPHSEGA